MHDFRQLPGKLEIFESWHGIRDHAHYDGMRPTLAENVHTEPAHRGNRVREIRRALFFQLFPGVTERSHQLIRDLSRMFRSQPLQALKLKLHELAAALDLWSVSGRKNQIADVFAAF